MIITPNSRAHKGKKGKYGGVCRETEGNADYGGMVQPSQLHVARCVKVVQYGCFAIQLTLPEKPLPPSNSCCLRNR